LKKYIYSWGNNEKRATLKGRTCIVLARGTMNSCMVQFLDNGQMECISRNALRKKTMKIDEALKLCELWEAGKMFGGNGNEVRKVLYKEVLKYQKVIEILKEENTKLEENIELINRAVKIESKNAGDRWKKYDAEVQDHNITKKENIALNKRIKELEGRILEKVNYDNNMYKKLSEYRTEIARLTIKLNNNQ